MDLESIYKIDQEVFKPAGTLTLHQIVMELKLRKEQYADVQMEYSNYLTWPEEDGYTARYGNLLHMVKDKLTNRLAEIEAEIKQIQKLI